MVTSTSSLAYDDCYEVLNKAAADPKGVRVGFEQESEAIHYRMRLHAARKINRDENAKTYDVTHPMHGKSEYDSLVIRVREIKGLFYLYIEKTTEPASVESLSDLNAE